MSNPTPSTPDPTTPSHPAHTLLLRAHSPQKATQIFTDKIAHKPLLLSTSTEHTTTNKRSLRRHIRQHKNRYALKHARPKPLSAKEKRALGLYTLRPEECKYGVYVGLSRLWRRYILEVLGYLDREGGVVTGRVGSPVAVSGAGALIASADFHGMEVEVVRCCEGARVGVRGIVVRETRSTVTVVCDEREDKRRRKRGGGGKRGDEGGVPEADEGQDKVRMILKKGTVFRVVVDLPTVDEVAEGKVDEGIQAGANGARGSSAVGSNTKRQLIFELHGDQLEIRPIERATKKFKWKSKDYL